MEGCQRRLPIDIIGQITIRIVQANDVVTMTGISRHLAAAERAKSVIIGDQRAGGVHGLNLHRRTGRGQRSSGRM